MWKKILVIVGVIALVAGGCVATYFITANSYNAELMSATSLAAEYKAKSDAIGPIDYCYTARTRIEPGTQITEDMLEEQSIPQSFLNEEFCKLEDIIGKPADETGRPQCGYFAKTYIEPGTPITKSLIMVEDIPDSAREIDITGNRWPIGLKEGDYVDIRITYSMGEDFIVLPHKRVYEINSQTLKMHMTEEEMHIYQAALVDWYLTQDIGTDLYFTKYIEPGVQEAATPYYTIPRNIETVCLADPNIVDKAAVSFKENLYKLQTAARDATIVTEEEAAERFEDRGNLIASGRDALNSLVTSDFAEWYEEYMAQQEQEAVEGEESDSLIDGGEE